MSDLNRFAARMKKHGDRLPKNVAVNVNRAALRILSVVVPATPVDTGRARGNWQTSIGSPLLGETGRLDKTGGVTINAGRAALSGRKAEQTIYITNNVPYIGRLNDGYSAQAPANFVERAIKIALIGVRNARYLR